MDRAYSQVLLAGMIAAAVACPGCKQKQEPAAPPTTPAASPAPAAPTTPAVAPPAAATPTEVPAKPLSVEETAKVKVTARVKAVDYTTREVTLEDAKGRTVTMVAGADVRRLDEVKPGDSVTAEYTVSLLAELRPPTAAETATPVAMVEIAGRSSEGSDPAAGKARATRVVTTVEAVDQAAMLVTLRGPSGDAVTVKGRNPDNVAKIKVGDTIVITYTESAVLALEKADK